VQERTSVAGGRTPGATPGQGIANRSDRANEVAQNVYKNKNLQGEFSDPDSPYYQGDGTETDENGQPIGNCVEINPGCTAGQKEIEDYIGDEIIIIGSSGESLYYYHPDHLGSASVITDGSGNLREHIEYFAFGETWVQEGASKKTPFMYTGKELDQETGLYYYGARYYDPRTSVWQSVDPILEKYLPSGDPEKDKNLPGMGGVFNSGNLAGYTYTHQNPVRYVDPDGNVIWFAPLVAKGLAWAGAAITAIEIGSAGYDVATGEMSAGEALSEHGPGIILGATLGATGKIADKFIDVGKVISKGFPKPAVENEKLSNLVNDLYKGANTKNPVGTGSTADAIRSEGQTGVPVGGRFHSQKGQQYINALSNWIRKNPDASEGDIKAANTMLNDLKDALGE